jgi:hypothetical protein
MQKMMSIGSALEELLEDEVLVKGMLYIVQRNLQHYLLAVWFLTKLDQAVLL